MSNAYRDENSVPTLIGALNTDGITVTRLAISPSTHRLHVDDNTTGSDHGPVNDIRDENHVPAMMAVSETDGQTPVVLYVTSDNKLLIDST